MDPTAQASDFNVLDFGRRYLGPLLELLIGWVLLVYGALRLSGRVQEGQPNRYPAGAAALAAGGILLWHSCGQF
jgi:hypothetical protein